MPPRTSSTRTPFLPTDRTIPTVSWLDVRRQLERGALTLIDVRSPKEYARGHMPWAVSVPLLDDEERHVVGLSYKQEGPLPAAHIGVEIFAAKAERFLQDVEKAKGDRAGPVAVHCWRGGMRSGFVARYLRAAGEDTCVLGGGYKDYRQYVLGAVEDLARKELVVLDGRTGSGKTALLARCAAEMPTIDFERLANHRGSAFGDFAQDAPCPPQQTFENDLAEAFERVRAAPTILVEIESYLGKLLLPPTLRIAVEKGPTVLVDRDFDDRVERLAAEYAPRWTEELDARFLERLKLLERYLSREQRADVIAAVAARDFKTAVALLLRYRYDKGYEKGLKRRAEQIVATFNLTRAEDEAMAYLRQRILGLGQKSE